MFCPFLVFAAGSNEGGTDTRSSYLAARGHIVPSDQVHVDSYLCSVDFRYPQPASSLFEVTMYTGHQQLSAQGQDEVLQIGIQAKKIPFEELTPMNLAFVIDCSGSMSGADKLEWVKDAFDVFITQVRDEDFVSLVVFNDGAGVVFPATRMNSVARRTEFRYAVHALYAGGGTNIRSGLTLGCLEVMKNFNHEYTNRVMLLSDGCDTCGNTHQDILEVARGFCGEGVTISTIGVGSSYDLQLMIELAQTGGGSSRFISDREEMERMFGAELDRMVVPVARNLEMSLEFLVDVNLLDTWGYSNRRTENGVRYLLPTLHHGDYETILVHINVPPGQDTGSVDLARFTVRYEDVNGNVQRSGPHILRADFVEAEYPVTGFTDGKILHSGTMLHFAQNLKTVGDLYYNDGNDETLEEALDRTMEMKRELLNARMRLGDDVFEDELEILDCYLSILGQELYLQEERIGEMFGGGEIAPPAPDRSRQESMKNLCREIVLDLQSKRSGVIAVCDFTAQGKAGGSIPSMLTDMALEQISRVDTVTLIGREELYNLLGDEGLLPGSLSDTVHALEVGRLLGADYVMTGNVIETTNTLVIFSRLLHVGSGSVESSAQVIIGKV
jgi:Ca-activated chloride channel family protein